MADYIVKPVSPARFIQAIEKAREIISSQSVEIKINNEEFIFIRDSNISRRLPLNDVLFAEALGDYVKLHTAERFYAIHTTFKTVEERLPPAKF